MKKVCLASSCGEHFMELMQLIPAVIDKECYKVTEKYTKAFMQRMLKLYGSFRFSILFLLIILPSYAFPTATQKTVYVSSSLGNDMNSGLYQDKPMKTITAAIRKAKIVRLRCGDVFYENVSCHNKIIDSYGKGAKPVISGFKQLKKGTGKWEEGISENGIWYKRKGTNIWRIKLDGDYFTGRIVDNTGFLNNIGIIVNSETGETYGKKCQYMKEGDCLKTYTGGQTNTYLRNNFDFYQTCKWGKKADFRKEDFDFLYLYLDHSPDVYNFIFSTYGNAFYLLNATVKNIKVQGFSCHGFACGSNTNIIGCEIDLIGGAQQIGYTNWVRYGNGIEFYISEKKKNGYVGDNVISRTFDCAVTIQASNHAGAYPENIVIEKNLIKNCRQAFEYFLNNKQEGEKGAVDCDDCIFRHNVCIDSGENGFNAPELRDTHILSYQKIAPSSMLIKDNIFIGGTGFYTAQFPQNLVFSGNVFYYAGYTILWTQGWKSGEEISFTNYNKAYHKVYSKRTGDNDTQIIQVSEKRLDRIKRKYLKSRKNIIVHKI